MGGQGYWNFGAWGDRRLVSNLKAWLTNATGEAIYQGWHGWHHDGPAKTDDGITFGRYHKVFVMVAKTNATDHDRTHTNVRLASAAEHIQHRCAFEAINSLVQAHDTFPHEAVERLLQGSCGQYG